MDYSITAEIDRLEREKEEMLMLADDVLELRDYYLGEAAVRDLQIRALKTKLAGESGNAKDK